MVVEQDRILTLAGDAEFAVAVGVTFLVTPAYHIAVTLQDGAVGESVADKVGAVGNHETGNIHGRGCGVSNLHIVQILTVGGDISAVARKNFTDNHRLGADIVAAALTVEDHSKGDSSRKQNDAGK